MENVCIIYAAINKNGDRLSLEYSSAKIKSIKDYCRKKFKDEDFKDIEILKKIDNVSENEMLIEFYMYKHTINFELKNVLLNEYNYILEKIDDKYSNLGSRRIKKKSLKKYLLEYIPEDKHILSDILTDYTGLMKICDTIDNYNTKISLLNDIKTICRDCEYGDNEYYEKIDDSIEEYKELLQIINLKQESRNNYNYNDLITLYQKYSIGSNEYLWLSCNLLIPPRRGDWFYAQYILLVDFQLLEEIDEVDESVNYLIIHDNYIELLFNNYKTKYKYGEYKKVLLNHHYDYYYELTGKTLINPTKLSEILIESYKNKPRKYLFDGYGESLSKYSKFVDSFLKNGYNLRQTDFRIIFISHIVNELKLNALTRTIIMPDMSHSSFNLQELHYIKRENPEEKIEGVNEEDLQSNNSIIEEDIVKIEEYNNNNEYIEEDIVIIAFNKKINDVIEKRKIELDKLIEQRRKYIESL